MEAVILILVLLFVAFVALGAYVAVKAVGAAKRGVDRTISQARRNVEETTLRAKSLGSRASPVSWPSSGSAAHVDAGHPGRAARGRGRATRPCRSRSASSSA